MKQIQMISKLSYAVIGMLLIAVSSCAGQEEAPAGPKNEKERVIAGGYSAIETDHPKVAKAVGFLTEKLGPLYPGYRITGVNRAEEQIVAGYKLRLLLSFAGDDMTGTLEALVFTGLDGQHRLLGCKANGEEITPVKP